MNKEVFDTFVSPDTGAFEWIGFYHKISESILKYKNSRKELIDLMFEIHRESGRTTKFLENKTDIDPFTVMSAFNMSLKPESTELLQKNYAKALGVEYTLSANNFLIPVVDNRNLDFLREGEKGKYDAVWKCFEAALCYTNDAAFIDALNEVFTFAGGKIVTISIVLYIISPDRFISLDKNTVSLIELIIKQTINIKKFKAEDYLELLSELKACYIAESFQFKGNKEVVLGSYLNTKVIEEMHGMPGDGNETKLFRTADTVTCEEWSTILNDSAFLTEKTEELFTTLLDFNGEASATQIAQKNNTSPSPYNASLGAFGKKVKEKLMLKPNFSEPFQEPDKFKYWWIPFTGKRSDNVKGFIWVLRPELKKALIIRRNTNRRYWLYSPGEAANMWDEFYEKGMMAIGWASTGDFNQYIDRDAIEKKLKEKQDSQDNPKQSSLMIWQFYKGMSVGDIVYAKKGKNKIIGRGIVESDYYYLPEEKRFSHCRKINWQAINEFEIESSYIKTLTDISQKKELINKIENGISKIETGNKNYWWLIAKPKFWSFSEINAGETIDYSVYTKKGNRRRKAENYKDAKVGDIAIGYEASPVKSVVSLLEVVNKDDKNIWFKKISDFDSAIKFDELKSCEALSDMEFFKLRNGSLFKLTESEFNTIIDLTEEDVVIPSSTKKEYEKYNKQDFLDSVFLSEKDLNKLLLLIKRKKNIILQGPPGVGKTFMAKRLAWVCMGEKASNRIEMIQFHQNYTYENFVEGFKPDEKNFSLKKGCFIIFVKRCEVTPKMIISLSWMRLTEEI